jgi:hypothetical protein
VRLEFTHPRDGRGLRFEATLGADFESLILRLGWRMPDGSPDRNVTQPSPSP